MSAPQPEKFQPPFPIPDAFDQLKNLPGDARLFYILGAATIALGVYCLLTGKMTPDAAMGYMVAGGTLIGHQRQTNQMRRAMRLIGGATHQTLRMSYHAAYHKE